MSKSATREAAATSGNRSTGAAQATLARRLLVSARDAAEMLSVCERTLWTLRARGDIPAIKVLGSVRYSVDDLQAFIDRQKAATSAPKAVGGVHG